MKPIGKKETPIIETESLKRLRALTRSAGPTDAIYLSGLTTTPVPAAIAKPKPGEVDDLTQQKTQLRGLSPNESTKKDQPT